ncbi:hypothetical protein [Exiguobacterium aurantiacum]|uniref:DUF4393 domain-containing protein n=1 Tax=Exiguobacterium aurantiacum TaxID=33987 RepID=A0A377FSQ9_9BACL|nr:hypothetical protein [Exiguobacterium aurantiacum]STO07594.1 Uncharacterised protein [Exiguobacterium aurantiacum]
MDFENMINQIYDVTPKGFQEPIKMTVGIGADFLPVFGKIYHAYQHQKINRALRELDHQIQNIKVKLDASDESMIFKEEIFPIIIKKMLDEPQEEKIKIIIDGFEHIVDRNISEQEIIFHYYDVLEELRMADIIFMCTNYFVKKDISSKEKVAHLASESEEELARKHIERYMANKLVRLGLLIEKADKEQMTYNVLKELTRNRAGYEYAAKFTINQYELTPFGFSFIDFFKLDM